MNNQTSKLVAAYFATVAVLPVSGELTNVRFVNRDRCDDLAVPKTVHELGLAPAFPKDERIRVDADTTKDVACPRSDDRKTINVYLKITNLTVYRFDRLWYVTQPDTKISNFDGLVNGQPAFQIDRNGANQPLVDESISPIDNVEHLLIEHPTAGDYVIEVSCASGQAPFALAWQTRGADEPTWSVAVQYALTYSTLLLAAIVFYVWRKRRARRACGVIAP